MLSAISALVAAGPASAQANHHPYPIGERATGLAGAFTALSDDAAGAWYNPAGLAFARQDSVSVSATLYGLVGASYPDSLGAGLHYDYATINVIPSSIASLIRVGAQRRDGTRPFSLAFNVFNPNTYQIDRRLQARERNTTLLVSTSDRLIAAGPSLGWRVSERLAIGASVLATLHTFADRVDLTDVRPAEFVQFTSYVESLSVGIAASIGVRYNLRSNVSLGLSARTPSLPVWGSGERFERTVRAPDGGRTTADSVLLTVGANRLWPALFRAGAAWSLADRFTLTADASLSLPLRFVALRAADGSPVSAVRLKAVVNGALGAEWRARPAIALRAGVFTDLSSAPTPLVDDSRIDQVDQLGATLTGTWFVREASTTLGAIATYGRARVTGVDVTGGTYAPFVVDGEQWRIFLVLAGTTRL
jgi:long-chain fatty acid transport protein